MNRIRSSNGGTMAHLHTCRHVRHLSKGPIIIMQKYGDISHINRSPFSIQSSGHFCIWSRDLEQITSDLSRRNLH